MKLSGE